jgi:ferredoxin
MSGESPKITRSVGPFSELALIVGSGPSGVAVALKLHNLGISAVMIDCDLKESDDFSKVESMGTHKRKLLFGSDFPYRHFNFGPRLFTKGSDLPYSFSQGGLSTIWGASFLPFSKNDVIDWPIDLDGLSRGYEFIAKRVPISSISVRKLTNYEDYQNQGSLKPDEFFNSIDAIDLISETLEVGATRLAVRAGVGNNTDCVFCGKCLAGCPTGSIWSSKDELNTLISNGLTYISGERVLSVTSSNQNFSVNTISKTGKTVHREGFSRVFIATGNAETFRILAESGMIEKKAAVRHSTTFYFPSIVIKKRSKNSSHFSLAQAFIRLQDKTKKSEAHFQLYSLSQEMMDSITRSMPIFRLVPIKFRSLMMSRIIMSIGYTDSVKYSKMNFELDTNGNCEIQGQMIATRFQIKRSLRRKVHRSRPAFKELGLLSLPSLSIVNKPGDGVHTGGWLLAGDKCDQLGTPFGYEGVHVVDSSVLPSIPDGPITFAVMANAVRIVSGVYE